MTREQLPIFWDRLRVIFPSPSQRLSSKFTFGSKIRDAETALWFAVYRVIDDRAAELYWRPRCLRLSPAMRG